MNELRKAYTQNVSFLNLKSIKRMDLQEVGCGYVDWIGLAQDRDGWRRLVSAVMNLRVP
jgi:hypothetical protein